MKWIDKRKNRIGINVHNSCKLAIRSFARKHDWTGTFEIEGFTSLTLSVGEENRSVTYHSIECIHGDPWYDCALVKFDDEQPQDESIKECVSPCQIYGFFKYVTPGVPTPYLIHDKNFTPEEIHTSYMNDSTLYAVVCIWLC